MITQNWGVISYAEALEKQLELVDKVASGEGDHLIFCSHPAVVTLGRGTKDGDVTTWSGETVEVSRGGRATYHGPSQLVVYPILDLTLGRKHLGPRDLRAYLKCLGDAIVATLDNYGIQSEYRSLSDGEGPSVTGVWVGPRKIASIGVAVRKWISYHGIALNLDKDPEAFRGISPCGFSADVMISLEEVLGQSVPRKDLLETLDRRLRDQLDL